MMRVPSAPALTSGLIVAALWLTACSSLHTTQKGVPAAEGTRAQLSIGYSLLYDEAEGIPKLKWIIAFKDKSGEMAQTTNSLVTYYQELADSLRRLSKEYPAVRLDVTTMSSIESDTRKAIGEDTAKDIAPLIGKSGPDFERETLLTFYDGLNEQRHLVAVMLRRETVPGLKGFLESTKTQLDERYSRVGLLVKRRYCAD